MPGRRPDHHGSAAPGLGLHRTEVLELHDRSMVALPEASVALLPLAGQRHHRSSTLPANDENSRGKVQNVRGDSSETCKSFAENGKPGRNRTFNPQIEIKSPLAPVKNPKRLSNFAYWLCSARHDEAKSRNPEATSRNESLWVADAFRALHRVVWRQATRPH